MRCTSYVVGCASYVVGCASYVVGCASQDGIFPGKVGRIFSGNIEISKEIFVENHTLCCISWKSSFFFSHKNNFLIKGSHLCSPNDGLVDRDMIHVTGQKLLFRILWQNKNLATSNLSLQKENFKCNILWIFWVRHLSKITPFRKFWLQINLPTKQIVVSHPAPKVSP